MKQYIKPQIARSIKLAIPKKRFELTERQIETLKNVSEVVLVVGMLAGTLALMVIAPNCFKILDKMPWAKKTYRSRDTKRRDQSHKITKSLYYLKSKGYIELVPGKDDFLMKITRKGRKKIQKMKFADLRVMQKSSWNKHWWIVIADVPKDYRHREDRFREKLKEMKFYPLQRTVWIYPFDPRDEIDFVSAYYQIERFVTTMEVLWMDPADEKVLKAYFREQ